MTICLPGSEILIHSGEYKNAQGLSGLMKGFLNNRFPSWLSPQLFDLESKPFGPFKQSLQIFDDLIIVPTYGHTDNHVSVILKHSDLFYFFAGDASYTQDNMLNERIDGVSRHNQVALNTLRLVKEFARENPTIYLPSHDPDSERRFRNQELVYSSEQTKAG